MFKKRKLTSEVFGISNTILVDSYIDRGNLDQEVQRYLRRRTHIALRGESKSGKSWFRQKNIPNALVVQCRFGRNVMDLYTDALSQLGIKLTLEETDNSSIKGRVEAKTEFGINLLAKIGVVASAESQEGNGTKREPVGHDINDLRYIADIIKHSEKQLVIEDFHYLPVSERTRFAYDLKTLWDYGCFVIIIGVWSQSNMLTYLNTDLSARIIEMSIYWNLYDLEKVIDKGSSALNVEFSRQIKDMLIENCYGNVGIIQRLIIDTLDEANITEEQSKPLLIEEIDYFETAALKYAEQLNPVYQQFASRVSSGIRKRKDSTGIYAHSMAVIVESSDKELIDGLPGDDIYQITHSRESRIQRGNLRVILKKLEELQVDEDGRGLVIAYDESHDLISAVDRQLLFYRKYLTVKWPWENLIAESESLRRNDEKEENNKENALKVQDEQDQQPKQLKFDF